MIERTRRVRFALAILAAYLVDAAWGRYFAVHEARPNLALTTLLVSSLLVGPGTGAMLGFFTGLLESAYTPIYVGSFLVSRSVVGWIVGSLEDFIFRDNVLIAAVTGGLGTLALEGLFFVFAPHSHVGHWIVRTGFEALYDAILAIPVYFGLRKIAGRRELVA